MNKKLITILRILLYLFAIFFILDRFIFKEKIEAATQLNSYKKERSDQYVEIFFKYDSLRWVTLQTFPISTQKSVFNTETIWNKESEIFRIYENRGLRFVGAYINDINLDAESFFIVASSIGKMGKDVSPKLRSITKQTSATLVFKKK